MQQKAKRFQGPNFGAAFLIKATRVGSGQVTTLTPSWSWQNVIWNCRTPWSLKADDFAGHDRY
jgi:hypothetical protein